TADGRIVLRGSKSVTLTAQSETIAQTADGAGGRIEVSAPEVKVEASALVDASGTQGGRIEIAAEQRATVEGTLRATGHLPGTGTSAAPVTTADIELPATSSGPAPAPAVSASAGRGGDIVVTADAVVLSGPATLNASGDTGGGSVLVGGDWQGSNPSVRNAQVSWIGNGVSLLADALLQGNGGKVVVWADRATAFAGNIWARGGSTGGNGGQVEVSGKAALLYRGRTDTTAARGRSGELLLDPLAIIIQGGSGDGSNDGSQIFASGSTPGTVSTDALGPTVIFESEIEEQSKTTNIILRAQRSVNVGSNQFSYTGSGNLAGETTGQLALASGSSLLIETRNLGVGEGGASAGIDLVSNGWHGSALQIITQGSGNITLQTGYSNGVKVGDQIANLLLPVLRTGAGSILVRSSDGSQVQLLGSSYTSGGAIQITASSVTGGTTFNAAAGTQITGDYDIPNGTTAFNGGASSISGGLTLSGTLTGDAALSLNQLTWNGGAMAGSGTTTLTGSGTVTNAAAYKYLQRRLDVAGALTFANSSSYPFYIQDGGTLNVTATGLINTAANGYIYLNEAYNGAGNGSASITSAAGGRINVAADTSLTIDSDNASGDQIGGSFALGGPGVLRFNSGVVNINQASAFTGAGALRISGSGTLNTNAATAFANLELDAGTLGGSASASIDHLTWNGGLMAGAGTVTLSGSGTVTNATSYKYLDRRLDVAGTLTFANSSGYDLYIRDNGNLSITSTGLVDTASNGFIYLQESLNGSGSGNGTVFASVSSAAGGRINVASGTVLNINADTATGNRIGGTFALTGEGVLQLASGTIAISDASAFTGAGALRIAGSTLATNAATSFANLELNAGTLAGSANSTIDRLTWNGGAMAGSGIVTLAGTATISSVPGYKDSSRDIQITGNATIANQNGYALRLNSARLYTEASGSLTLVDGAQILHTGTGRIDNGGLMVKTGAAPLSLAVPLTNAGTLRIEEGSLTVGAFPVNAGRLTILAGANLITGNANLLNTGVIDGRGTINVGTGTLTNAGTVRPGDSGGTGTLAVTGNFAQTAAGRLEADVLGVSATQQDHLDVSGS
ncbi:MAG TPA: hypothetical protein VIO81_02900, partial [Methyloversatilis sp.]